MFKLLFYPFIFAIKIYYYIIIYFFMAISFLSKKIMIFSKKSHYNFNINKNISNQNNCFDKEQWEKQKIIYKKYSKFIKQHEKLEKEINILYSVVNNLYDMFSKEAIGLINLLLHDIHLAHYVNIYYDELRCIGFNYNTRYDSFLKLTIIFEKRKEFKNAIIICMESIRLNYLDDGTPSTMIGRLSRLIKKYNQTNDKKLMYDLYSNNIYYTDTGEIFTETYKNIIF